jgi:leader peptidase (prepilin peptidase) / N-methyltransferase
MTGETMLYAAVSAVLGLVIGSFLNVVIFRLKSGKTLNGRSQCLHCKHILSAWDLVPVFSFVFLRGKCRYCDGKISWQYPMVELFTAIFFWLAALKYGGPGVDLMFAAILGSFLIVIAVYDLKHYLILDKVVFPGIVIAAIYSIASGHVISGLAGAAAVSGFFYLQYLVSRGRWIGFGDVKFGLMLGLIGGWPVALLTLFLAYMLGAVTGVSLIAAGAKQLGSKLPFGTFLSFAAIITMLYGQEILDWYMALVGFR